MNAVSGRTFLPLGAVAIALVLGVSMGLRSNVGDGGSSALIPAHVFDLRSLLPSTHAGGLLTIHDFAVRGDGLYFLIRTGTDQDWRILQTDAHGESSNLVNLLPGYYDTIAVRESGEIAVYRPSEHGHTVSVLSRAGSEVATYDLKGPVHSMCFVNDHLVALFRDGTFQEVASADEGRLGGLSTLRVTLAEAPIGLLALPDGRLAAWNRANAGLTLLDPSSGTTAQYRLSAPEIDSGIAAYALQREDFAKQSQPGQEMMTGLAVPGCAAGENGNIFALVSPYNFSEGARVLELTATGQLVRSLRCKLPPLNADTSRTLSPASLGLVRGKLVLVDRRGSLAVYSL
jgi:hypothetical protein